MASKRDRIADAKHRHKIEEIMLRNRQRAELDAIRAEPDGPEDKWNGVGRPPLTETERLLRAYMKYDERIASRKAYLLRHPNAYRSEFGEARIRLQWREQYGLPSVDDPYLDPNYKREDK